MVKTTWDMITSRMDNLKKMHDRMDATRKLVYLDKYELRDSEDGKLDNVINVTGNKAAVFGNVTIADLQKTVFQTVIEGDISKRDASRIEQFIDDNLQQADEYLLERYGLVGLFEWLCNHVCIRGPIGVEWYPWLEDSEYNVHCLPLDMRWTSYQYGKKGWKWVAPISWRSSDELINELEGVEGADLTKIPRDKGENEVRDYWDAEKNELWVEKGLVLTQPNPVKKPPFVIVFPPAGFLLRDKGYLEHEAEDIFYLIRGLNDEVNRTLSIEQSLIFNVLRPPMEREVPNPSAKDSLPAPLSGETLDVGKGERHVPIPTGDLNRANLTAQQSILKMVDEGAPIAPRMYTQPPSGAELLAEMEALERLQNSRIIALRVFQEQLVRLMIEEYRTIASGGAYAIGKAGRRRSYSVVQLKDPDKYSVSFRTMTKNKRQELANLAMFSASYNQLPLRYNLENILQAEDPDGILRALDIEAAKKADPAIGLFEMAIRYAEEAEDIEDEKLSDAKKLQSMMLTERGVSVIKQRKMPQQLPEKANVPQVETPTGGQAQTLLPSLLGGGGGRAPIPEGGIES